MADTTIDIKAKDKVSPVLKKIELEMAGFKRQIDSFSAGFHKMLSVGGGVGAAYSLYNMTRASLDAQMQLQRLELSYQSIFGQGASRQLQAVYEQTQRVGLEYTSTAEAAKSFFAAGQDSTLAPDMNRIFTSVTNAGAALQLSTEQMNGVFIALGQMISKGKVQAEELRGQLGERLPGAFQMAAKAMGMTTAELDKFMADGKLTAEELLPRLVEVLEGKYATAAENAANTVQGAINRMSTEWTLFKANILNSEGVITVLNGVTGALNRMNQQAANADARKKAIAALEAEGVAPAAVQRTIDVGASGLTTESVRKVYSEAQIKAEAEFQRMKAEQEALAEAWETNQAARSEKIVADMRRAVNVSLKDTTTYKLADMKRQKEEALAKIQGGIDLMMADDTDLETIMGAQADLSAASAAWDAKIKALQDKSGKSGASAAKKAAVAQADYTGELERTRQQIGSLQEQLGLDSTESLTKAKIRIEQQYQATLSKTKEELSKQVARGSMSQSQADVLRAEKDEAAALQMRLSLREAEEKAHEKESKNLQVRADFYKDLADRTGEYDASLEYQNRLLERQAEIWLTAKVPMQDVTRMLELQRLEMARDPWSGMTRSVQKFYSSATDYATGFEQVATQGLNGVSSTLTSVLWKGEQDFASFFQSIGQMLTELALKASVAQIGGGLAGLLGDLFSSSITLPGFTSADLNTSSWGGAKVKHGGGMGWESSFYRPVPRMLFARAPRFHKGRYYDPATELPAIIRKDESVLTPGQMRAIAAAPVPRVLPVDTGRNTARNAAPVVNITVINQAGAEVETNQRQNSDGGIDLKIMMLKEVARDTARRGGFNNNVLRNQFGASKRPIKY